ncbi:MAG: hypothetical protein JWN48_5232 [Myxococcaceae bacterium]|nr:hypothetical protein [Myxococcaceae bacterium]
MPGPWTDAQRRILLNLWCRVARADGIVADSETERLSQLFYRLGDDLLTADEVVRWLDDGPPEITELLPPEAAPVFLEHAREIMLADQEVVPLESDLVRELLSSYFRAA